MGIEIKQPLARDLFLIEIIDQKSIGAITKSIIDINSNDDELEKIYVAYNLDYKRMPIRIFIDSYGGFVYQMLGVIAVIEKSKTPIHTIATGAAMSCGFMILICGHKRFAYKHATPLYHQVSSWAAGKFQDMKEDLKETERLQTLIEQITIQKTSIKKSKLKEIKQRKIDWFMTAKEALSLNVIDEIL